MPKLAGIRPWRHIPMYDGPPRPPRWNLWARLLWWLDDRRRVKRLIRAGLIVPGSAEGRDE